jgi:formylglycine-generating enzyme required for sulfatase activity
MSVLDVLDIPKEDLPWFRSELFRRAAMCFEIAAQEEDRSAAEQRGFWYDAAECWADAGDTARAAVIYRRLDDHAQAAPLLLINGQWGEALACYRAWLAELDDRDEGHPVGRTRAWLGIAAGLRGEAGEARQRGDRATRERKRRESRAAYQQARNLIEEEEERDPLAAGRCWEALGWYGQVMGRHDLVQVGYEMALRRYGERHNRERVRTARAYLDAVGETNRLLAAELEARLAEWAPPETEGELREWQRLRDEIEEIGFQDGVRDVLHFVDEETQLEAWWELAEITDDPDQAAIDDYLRDLAPEGMVYVPAGPFLMGSTEDDPDARDNEKPQHEVELPGYYIGRTPVTNEAYAEFIAAGGYETRDYWTEAGWARKERAGWTEPRFWSDENHNQPRQPVVGVSWYEAVAYCRWRGLRLPTEAEWEKAAGWDPQAGRKRKYPWGDEWDQSKCEVLGEERAAIVGKYSPVGDSFYGLSDMAGNVLEWCSTRWAEYPYRVLDGREDLEGGDDVMRVLRSSYFGSYPGTPPEVWARCAYRNGSYPRNWSDNRGLRVSAPRRLLFPDPES